MIRKDYIQRYFDEMAKVLAAMLLLKKNNDPIKAESLLNDFSTDYLGLKLEEILCVEDGELITFLIQQKKFTLDHFKLLENILYHKYLFNKENSKLKNSTLEILNYLSKNDNNFSIERMNRITELDQ